LIAINIFTLWVVLEIKEVVKQGFRFACAVFFAEKRLQQLPLFDAHKALIQGRVLFKILGGFFGRKMIFGII
jgi:hypothetical protein